jgi:ABC-type transport system substrate-binding protein
MLHNSTLRLNDEILPLGAAPALASLVDAIPAGGGAVIPAALPWSNHFHKEFMMKFKPLLIAAAVLGATAVHGATVRIANQAIRCRWIRNSLNRVAAAFGDGNVLRTAGRPQQGPEPGAALATAWKQTSPTVWRFELRKGVQFHDGKPFTADDVVFSLSAPAATAPT